MAVPKVLVLHGYTQSATIFSKRMGAVRKTVGKDAELVFINAPHILLPADLAATFGPLEALGAGEASVEAEDPALLPRAWWRANRERTMTIGIEESITLLRDILHKNQFDGVFGFSQGAAMAAILAALLERPHAYPPFLVDGAPPHPPFKFAVCVAGFRATGPVPDAAFGVNEDGEVTGYTTPTLHVLGRTDIIVVEERAKSLIAVSRDARVIWHEGGHFVPSKGSWRAFFRAYLKNPLGNVPAPGDVGGPESAPASGTATPAHLDDAGPRASDGKGLAAQAGS